MDKTVKIARGAAFVVTAIMVHYFITNASKAFRDDNPFIVPDVAFTVLIFVSALLPRRYALPALLFSFSMAAGVITVSIFDYVVVGEFALLNLALLIGLVTTAALIGRALAAKKAS